MTWLLALPFCQKRKEIIYAVLFSSIGVLIFTTDMQILSLLPSYKGKSVLELGAGIGRFTGDLAKEAGHVLALDFIESVIKKVDFLPLNSHSSRNTSSYISIHFFLLVESKHKWTSQEHNLQVC